MKKFILSSIFAVLLLCGIFAIAKVATDSGALPGKEAYQLAIITVLALNLAGSSMVTRRFGVIDATVVANTIQPLYNKKLLDRAIQETRLIDFAMQEEMPANEGATTMRFFRPPQADLTATGAPALLTEGVTPTNKRDISYTPIDVTLAQIGQWGSVTDIATNVGLLKYLNTAIDLYGDEFALDVDTRIRNVLCHQTTGFVKRYAQGLANFAGLAGASAANGRLVPRDLLDATTALKIARAPKINGVYVCAMAPQGTRDVINDAEFREVVRQNYADKIFKGEVGDYNGLRIVEATNPFQEDETEGTFASTFSSAGTNTTGFIYSAIVTGKNGYGTVNLKKLGASMNKPSIIIATGADKADPLNQQTTVGWKAYWAAVLLKSTWGVTLRHKTQFV